MEVGHRRFQGGVLRWMGRPETALKFVAVKLWTAAIHPRQVGGKGHYPGPGPPGRGPSPPTTVNGAILSFRLFLQPSRGGLHGGGDKSRRERGP